MRSQSPRTSDEVRSLLTNVRTGTRYGLIVALVLVAWVTVLRLVNGEKSFAHLDTTYGSVVLFYLLGGLVAGAMLGAMRPLMRTKPGLAIAVALVAIPVTAAARVMWSGFTPWTHSDSLLVMIVSVSSGLTAFVVSLTD